MKPKKIKMLCFAFLATITITSTTVFAATPTTISSVLLTSNQAVVTTSRPAGVTTLIRETKGTPVVQSPVKIAPQPQVTKIGAGGSSTLDGQYSNIYWKVKPATNWPYIFNGTLEVAYNSGEVDYYTLSGYPGAFGSSVGDYVGVLHRGGYNALLVGEATDLQGISYVVLPDCRTSFGY